MFKSLKQFVDSVTNSADEETESHAHANLSAVALLIETAKIDQDFSEEELNHVLELSETLFAMTEYQKDQLFHLARQKANDSTSLYEFTNDINEQFSADEKFDLVKAMWQVAYADGQIDRFEEHLIRKVADLIYVPHVQFIEAKHLAEQSAQ